MAAEYEVNIKINTQQIERELKKVDKAVKNIGKAKGGSRASGLGLMPNDELKRLQQSRIYLGQAVQSIDKLAKIQDRRARSLNKINELEAKGLNVGRLRKQLAKATTEQSARRFGSAEKEFRVLEKTLRLEQSKLRILREQRKGFPSSPIRGTRTMMGSPAQIAASGRQRVSPIAGRIDIAGSPAQMQAIRQLEMAEIRADKNAHFAELRLIQKRQKIQLDNVDKLFRANERELEKFNKKLEAADKARQKRLAGAPIPGLGGRTFGPSRAFAGPFASPIGGTEGTPGSPAFNRALELGRFRSSPIGGRRNIAGSPEARRFRRQRLEQVGLGAGFPLLFGGGPGSVLGGALGGLTGSFGAQIAFSAIGQQIDQFVAGMVDAGKALTSVGGAADFMAEKSLFSSDTMQFRIEKLIEEGKVSEAAALMTQEMAKKVGGTGLKALKDLGTEASKMGKLFGTVMLRIQAFMARALTPLIKLINSAIGGMVAQNQLDQMLAEAGSPEQRAAILARSQELRGTKKQGRASVGRGEFTMEMLQTLQTEFPAIIPEGAEIKPTQLEVLRAADAGGGKAAREEERLQKRLGRLEAERKKMLEVSRFKDKIAAAEAAEDKQLVIRLKGEQKLAEIEASRKKALAGITEQREIDAINIGKATEKLAAHRETERQLAKLQRQRQEKFNDTIDDLDHQLALARATTEEERQRLRIQQKLAVLKEGGMSEDDLEAVRAKMEELADENSPLNRFIRQTREQIEQLNDPVFRVIELSKTLGDAFSQSFRGIIDGSMTAQQALANLFQRTADHFLDMAVQMIAAQIKMKILGIGMQFFGGGGATASQGLNISGVQQYVTQPFNASDFTNAFSGKALGGAVGAGRPYMVGERGPELFVPGAQGNIVPSNAMGSANVTVNVDASGSSVEGNADQASQLGKAIGIAVQQELVKQKRPGGLLAR